MRTLSFILPVLFFSVSLTAQSGWTQPQGAGFFKLNQSALRAGDLYNLEGKIIDITTTSVYISSIYAEYGFSDRITGIAYVPFFVRSTLNRRESRATGFVEPGDQINGFGDPLIGLRVGILDKGPIVLSADAMVGIPLGENVGGDTELLQTGDGEFNQLVRLSASRSFPSASLYGTLTVGFNNRTTADFDFSSGALEDAEFSDEVHWGGRGRLDSYRPLAPSPQMVPGLRTRKYGFSTGYERFFAVRQ